MNQAEGLLYVLVLTTNNDVKNPFSKADNKTLFAESDNFKA